jgi:hypothetical protein
MQRYIKFLNYTQTNKFHHIGKNISFIIRSYFFIVGVGVVFELSCFDNSIRLSSRRLGEVAASTELAAG